MAETTQLNVRLSESLLKDIDIVSKMLNISKTDWIRLTLARGAFEEKTRLLQEMKMREVKRVQAREFEQDVFQEIRSMENMMQAMLKENERIFKKLMER